MKRVIAIVAMLWISACGNDPVAPSADWLLHSWRFDEGGCWPEIIITPETLGYDLSFRLAGTGDAEIRHNAQLFERQRFTAQYRSNPFGGPKILILEFERALLMSTHSFRAQQEQPGQLLLSDWAGTDGCGFRFVGVD